MFFMFWLEKEWNILFLYLLYFGPAAFFHSIAAKSSIFNKKSTLVSVSLATNEQLGWSTHFFLQDQHVLHFTTFSLKLVTMRAENVSMLTENGS